MHVDTGYQEVFTGLRITRLQQLMQPEHEELDHFAFALHEHFCLKTSHMLSCVEDKMMYLNAEHTLAELIPRY